MFRLQYRTVQPSLPCKLDLDSDHECEISFGDMHMVAFVKSPEIGNFTDITYESLCTGNFVFATITPRRDPHGHLKASVVLHQFPVDFQTCYENDAKIMTLALLQGRLAPGSVLAAHAHFDVNILLTKNYQCPLTTTVRFWTAQFAMVEDNPIVVLPYKLRTKPKTKYSYRNFDKPAPTKVEFKTSLCDVFEDGDVFLPVRK